MPQCCPLLGRRRGEKGASDRHERETASVVTEKPHPRTRLLARGELDLSDLSERNSAKPCPDGRGGEIDDEPGEEHCAQNDEDEGSNATAAKHRQSPIGCPLDVARNRQQRPAADDRDGHPERPSETAIASDSRRELRRMKHPISLRRDDGPHVLASAGTWWNLGLTFSRVPV